MIKKWINNVFIIGLAAILAFSGFFLIKGKFSNDGNPEIFGHKLLVVVSGSMEPRIPVGAIVISRQSGASGVIPNDVITFSSSERQDALITHRVIAVNEDGSFVTKGDANDVIDPDPVQPERVLGKTVFTVPYVGYLAVFAGSKLGMLLLIVVPGFLIITAELIKLARYLKKEEKVSNTPKRLDIK